MLTPEITTGSPTAVLDPDPARRATDVAIVGGGASGTLCAIHLMASRSHDLGVGVFEASGVLGHGLAYGTTDPRTCSTCGRGT